MKIYDQLKHLFGAESESVFTFKKCNDGAMEISFKHNFKYWMIHFAADFPTTPAKLFHSTWEDLVRSNECSHSHIAEPLINEVNILLTMKDICTACKICKNFTKESLSQPYCSSRSLDKLSIAMNSLAAELRTTLVDVTELNIDHTLDVITFNHGTKWWIINVTAQFPDTPAKVYYKPHKESSNRYDAWYSLKKQSRIRVI